jgi:hypothetical protein
MTINLWNDIDTVLSTIITADMGEDGDYESLPLVTVQVTHEWQDNYSHSPVGQIALPCCFIVGREWEPSNRLGDEPQGPHRDGVIHMDIAYPYELIVIGPEVTTYSQALQDSKELVRRLREVIRDNNALGGLVADDGEALIDVVVGNATVVVQGSRGGKYISGGYLPITIYSEV